MDLLSEWNLDFYEYILRYFSLQMKVDDFTEFLPDDIREGTVQQVL